MAATNKRILAGPIPHPAPDRPVPQTQTPHPPEPPRPPEPPHPPERPIDEPLSDQPRRSRQRDASRALGK